MSHEIDCWAYILQSWCLLFLTFTGYFFSSSLSAHFRFTGFVIIRETKGTQVCCETGLVTSFKPRTSLYRWPPCMIASSCQER